MLNYVMANLKTSPAGPRFRQLGDEQLFVISFYHVTSYQHLFLVLFLPPYYLLDTVTSADGIEVDIMGYACSSRVDKRSISCIRQLFFD